MFIVLNYLGDLLFQRVEKYVVTYYDFSFLISVKQERNF